MMFSVNQGRMHLQPCYCYIDYYHLDYAYTNYRVYLLTPANLYI